jgi:DNA polymerase I-like protein with 3'-5' exonuclease and polymerase domains/uracil-DNA glycosylase
VLLKSRVGGPVGPEYHDTIEAAIIAETPGEKECAVGRPLLGPSGMELTETLPIVGSHRSRVDLHYAVACMPPEGDLDKVLLRLSRENKRREKAGEKTQPNPIECCRPRLLAELRTTNLVTLGRVAHQSITRTAKAIAEIRGGPVEGHLTRTDDFRLGPPLDPSSDAPVKLMPTLHPSHVQKARRWTRAFRTDLGRAFRWFSGRLDWRDPTMNLHPTPDELADWLLRHRGERIVFDVETTIDDPTEAKLKCVGLSTETEAIVVPILSIEGPGGRLIPAHGYTDAEAADLRAVLTEFFTSAEWTKVGHNAGYFDRMVIRQHFGVDPEPLVDTILLHRAVESELPHRLAYVGSVYTDVSSWKAAHTAKTAATDHELLTYCAIDCAVTARVLPKLESAAAARDQLEVVRKDHDIQRMCVGMHEQGMWVDRQRRDEEAVRLRALIVDWSARAREAAGIPDLNLNSTPQLRDLLFSKWRLTPADYTKLGDPSTDDDALRLMRTQNAKNTQVVRFIDNLRRARTYLKEYGTYVRRMVPYGQPLDGFSYQSEDEEDAADRGLILSDGRMHPDYTAHGTTSGRISSSGPNAQNFPKHLRGMIAAAPGRVLVGADADQLELRIIAAIAGMTKYLEVFAAGGDPHALTASLMFGTNFDEAESGGDQWTKLRNLSKGIKYASFYGSGDETVHGIVTSAEDKEGNLLYPNLTVREVALIRRNWLKGIPQLAKWWDATLNQYREQGYIRDPVWGRRRDFLDGENFNETVNFPIQGAGAHIIHESTFELLRRIPFGYWGHGTGLVCQVHDALYAEAPCPHPQHEVEKLPNGKPNEKLREFGWCPPGCQCEANWTARQIEQSMNRAVPGLDGVVFKAKAKIGRRWSDV